MKATRTLAALFVLASIAISGCGGNQGKFEDMALPEDAYTDISGTIEALNKKIGDPQEKIRSMNLLTLGIKQKKINEADIPKLVETLRNVAKENPKLAETANKTLQAIADAGYEVEGLPASEAPAEG